jgi:predicted Zn-dependent protease
MIWYKLVGVIERLRAFWFWLIMKTKLQRAKLSFAMLMMTISLISCAQFEQPTTRALLSLPSDIPRTTDIESPRDSEHKRLISQYGGIYHAEAVEQHLNQIVIRLSQASEGRAQVYRVTILNSPLINAFARPSGDIYVTRGLLGLANDSSEIAAVMAHEIGHVVAQHAVQRDEVAKDNIFISRVAEAMQGSAQKARAQTHGLINIAQFSRQQEFEADEFGIRLIAHAGYDPMGAIRVLNSLARYAAWRQLRAGRHIQAHNDLLSSHPSTPERIAHAGEIARPLITSENSHGDRDIYLPLLDGIIFGDHPDEGLIKGRVFIHPRLGFSFIAPEDFSLDNSSHAVVGIGHDGREVLRLDSIKLSADQTLESYLASGWIDGLIANSIISYDINGFSAVKARAQTGSWSFDVVLIRVGTNIYRLIYAGLHMDHEMQKRFSASISSFKRVSIEEAHYIKPLHISIVTAQEGMQIESLAQQMVSTDQPVEQFRILNGLDKSSALRNGERYKIIRD